MADALFQVERHAYHFSRVSISSQHLIVGISNQGESLSSTNISLASDHALCRNQRHT